MLVLECHLEGPVARLVMAGDCDVHGSPELTRRLRELATGLGAPLEVDLRQVNYLAAGGLEALRELHETLAGRGLACEIVAASPTLWHQCETLGLDGYFSFRGP